MAGEKSTGKIATVLVAGVATGAAILIANRLNQSTRRGSFSFGSQFGDPAHPINEHVRKLPVLLDQLQQEGIAMPVHTKKVIVAEYAGEAAPGGVPHGTHPSRFKREEAQV